LLWKTRPSIATPITISFILFHHYTEGNVKEYGVLIS
jgi:hypothetical protein